MNEFINTIRESAGTSLNGVSDGVIIALCIVGGLLVILSVVAFVISAFLSIAYVKYNRKKTA